MTDEEIERHLIQGTRETQLRALLGDYAYDALRAEAQAASDASTEITQEFFGLGKKSKPNVYILPGIMGSKLSAQVGGDNDLVWFDPIDIRNGGVAKLKFRNEPNPVVATGTFWAAYGALRLRLAGRGYKVRFLPFDWRRSIPDIGEDLLDQITGNGDHGAVLAAHSMGGLVARQMAALDNGQVIKCVVTMGTPNYGSYSPVQVFRVASNTLSKVGKLDKKHSASEIAKLYLRHFPGLVEMMPAPEKRPEEAYFDPSYWPSGGAKPNNKTLSDALKAKDALPLPDKRFHQIIGYGQRTVVAATKTASDLQYRYSSLGDGTVPVDLAQVDTVPQYFVQATHGGMVQREDVARAVHELIQDAATDALSRSAPQADFASENLSAPRSDDDVRSTFGSEPLPDNPNDINILSEFLAPPTASQPSGVSAHNSAKFSSAPSALSPGEEAPDMSRKIGGYPLSVLMQASKTWRGKAEATTNETTGSHVRETEQRLKKYAARKLQQLRAIVEETPKQRVLPERLQKIVAAAEDDQAEAINSLLNERVMGEAEEFLSVQYLKRAPIVSKSVGRIIRRNSENGFGTGFMVAPNVLITNHHVLPDPTAAENAAIQFDYEINYRNRAMPPQRFNFQPELLFYNDRQLDFALVAVEPVSSETGRAVSDFGYLPLDGGEGKIKIGKPINIIQHPNAETKQAVFRDGVLQDLPANELAPNAQFTGSPPDIAAHYNADTKPGASGAAVFSDEWEVIALHHSGVAVIREGKFQMKDGTFQHPNTITDDDEVNWVANEGIRISRIVRHLEENVAAQPPAAQQLINDVLRVGKDAQKYGHFYRPMPQPVLTQFETTSGPARTPPPVNGTGLAEGATQPHSAELEGLLSTLKQFLSGTGAVTPTTASPQSSGALIVDSAGVAQGTGRLAITYRGNGNSPYGVSATANQRPFDSIVLHHNAPNLSADWLIQYQINGDPKRGGHFGYHFYVDPNGSVLQGAPLIKRTNHVKSPSHAMRKPFGQIASNNSSIGITCVKAGPHYIPTAAQIAAQDGLVRALAATYNIPFTCVFGHGEIQSDRNAGEGTSQAEKIRGWRSQNPTAEALFFDENTDDTALEAFAELSASTVDDVRWAYSAGLPTEDDDDLAAGAISEGEIALFSTSGAPIGAEIIQTSLVYTNLGAIRNRPCTANLEARLVQAVEAVYGQGCRIEIYSGGQDRLGYGPRRTGSIRHDDYGLGGRAADIYLLDQSGAKVRGLALAKLGQYWLAAGFGCVGHEMERGGIHLDEWVPPPAGGGRLWTYAASNNQPWGERARTMLEQGAAGIYP